MLAGANEMNSDDIKQAADKAGAWTKAHPEIMQAAAYIGIGIMVGWFLFA